MKYKTHYTIEGGLTHDFYTETPITTADKHGELVFSEKNKRQQKMILDMMEFLLKVTKKHKIKWFAICGTLLGAVRNQGIIPYDDDGDIGFLISEYDKFMKLTRMDLHPQFAFVESECGVQLVQKPDFSYVTHFDLFAFDISKDEPEKLVYAGHFWKGRPTFYASKLYEKEWIYKKDVDKIVYRKFEHLRIPTPANTTEYLSHVYGANCLTVYVPDTRNVNGFHMHELYMSLISNKQRIDIGHAAHDFFHPIEMHRPNLDSHMGLMIVRIMAIPTQMNNDFGKSCRMVKDAVSKYVSANMYNGCS